MVALLECKKFFEGEIKKLNWQMNFVESTNESHLQASLGKQWRAIASRQVMWSLRS